jgi:hypothetical protein
MHEGAMPGFEGLYIPMFSPPCQNNTDALQRNLKGIKKKKGIESPVVKTMKKISVRRVQLKIIFETKHCGEYRDCWSNPGTLPFEDKVWH